MTNALSCPVPVQTDAQVPRFAVAGDLLECFAARDFTRMVKTLSEDATFQALVPRGLREWAGRDSIAAAFGMWFGDAEEFELLAAEIGEIGTRLHLQWRVRLKAERLGPGWFVVEQHLYADTDLDGLISRLSLLCSGYCPDVS
jgi:hypothetical protein